MSRMSAPPDCPGIDSWPALLAAALPAEERRRCERHLGSCPACQERLDQAAERDELVRLARQVGDPTAVPPDPTLAEVLQSLHRAKAPAHEAAEGGPDLYFLRPAERPGVLGLLGEY